MAKDMFSGTLDVSSILNTIKQVAAEAQNGTKSTDELTNALKRAKEAIKALTEAEKKLADAQVISQQLRDLKDTVLQLQNAMGQASNQTKNLSTKLNSMKDAVQATGLKWKDFSDNFTKVSDKLNSSGNAIIKYSDNLNRTVTVTKKMINGEETFTATLDKSNKVKQKAVKTEKQVGEEVQKTTKHIKNQAFATENWAYNWSKAMQSFLTYNTVTQFFNTIMNGIRDMIDEVEELDAALTELQKVTDLEGESLAKFVNEAYEAGKTVAKTGTEMVEAATAFAKAGYKDNALELGTVAAMYTNIADEAIDAADAADMIIAQMKAFNIQAEDSIHIIDAINEVSNNFAVSSADISRNLGKASAVVANAGNSMEQYIGLMTAATEVTRNASKAANGLKTLTLRLQGMNDEGEKDLEVQAQMEALFQKLGISVYKANGELKNTYEILEALAPVYATLTNAEKAYVTETIAGKYQAQNAAAILMNWKTAVDATTTAMNSNGSAAKENEKVLKSIRGHLQQLKSAWEDFSRKLIDSNLIKFVVDLGTWILKLANSGFGQLVIKAGLVAIAYKVLKASITRVIVSVKAFNVSLAESYLILQGYPPLVAKTVAANATLGTSFQIAGASAVASMKSMAVASLKFLATPAGIALAAVAALGAAIYAHNKAIEEHIERMEKMNEQYEEDSNQINESIDNFKKYRAVLADTNATEEEKKEAKKELLEIQNQLAKKYDIEADKLKLVNGEYEEQLRLLKEIEQQKATKFKEDNYGDIEKAKNYLNSKVHYGIKTTKVAHAEDYEKYPKYEKFLEETAADGVTKTREQWIKFYDEQIEKIKEYGAEWGLTKDEIEKTVGVITESKNKIANDKQFKESQKTYENYIEAEIQSGEKWSDTYYKIKEQQAKYAEAIKNGDKEGQENALEELNKLQDKLKGQTFKTTDKDYKDQLEQYNYMVRMFDDYRDEIKKHNFIKDYFKSSNYGDSEYKKAIDGIVNGLKKDLGKEKITTDDFFDVDGKPLKDVQETAEKYGFTVDELVDSLVDLNAVSEGTNHIVSEFANKTESWSKSVDALQQKYQDLAGVMEEYNETGYITIDSLQTLLEKDWEYLQYLEFENGQLKLNTDALKAEASAKLDEAEATAYADAIQSIKLLKSQNETEVNKHLQTSYENLKTKIDAMHDSYNTLINDEATLNAIRNANGEDGVKAYENVQKELNTKLQLINNARQNLNRNFGGAMGASSSKSGGSSSKSEKEWWEQELDALKDQYDNNEITINEYINSLQNLLGKVGQGTEAWKKINKELQKQKLDKIKDDYNAGRISLNQYIISLQNLQKEYRQSTKEWNSLADAIKKAKLDQLKEQQNDLKAALSAVNNTLEKQIEDYEDLKDAADERYDDELDRLGDLQDALNDKNDDYERAQRAVVDFLNEQLDAINEQRDTVENYYDNVIDAIEKMNEDTKESIELAEAYDALMNAMTQKTKKVYKEGLGWIWTTDAEAIKNAKKTYDDLVKSATTKEIEEQKDKAVNSLEEQIEALQNYIDSWDKVFDKFDNEKNRNLADILLGENWSEMVSNLDPQIVDDFSDAYYELQKNLDETAKQIEELNKQKEEEDEYWDKLIKDLQDYKGEWSDIANVYEEAQNALKAKQIMGANWEKEILDRRLDVLENFKNKYNAILAEIDKVDNMSTDEASGYTALRLPGYANGGEVDYTGLAVLHGTPNKPEYVLNNAQMRNLLGNLTRPRTTSAINNKNSGAVINNYSFGDIELPNVTNAQQFANELKSMLNITKNQ